MDYEYFILNNVALSETFMAMYQVRIDALPDVLLIDYRDLARYIFEFVDDTISQYSSWSPTTNKADDIEEELRSKVNMFGAAYKVDMTPYLNWWFEGLDKFILCILEDNIRQIHNQCSRRTVFKMTTLVDGTIALENLGEANEPT